MEKTTNITNIYKVSEDILADVITIMQELDYSENEIAKELYKFLITDNSQYEKLYQINTFKFIPSEHYKIIMMLIIGSSGYKMCLHNIEIGIDVDRGKEFLMEFEGTGDFEEEQLDGYTYLDWLELFKNAEDARELILDYLEYFNMNYVYRNDCLKDILVLEKREILQKLNPFSFFEFDEYIQERQILMTDRFVADFLDIIEKAYEKLQIDKALPKDYPKLRTCIHRLVCEKFQNDSQKISLFYCYILGNVYENLKLSQTDGEDITASDIENITFFENSATTNFDCLNKYFENDDFFYMIMDGFAYYNASLTRGELLARHDDLEERGYTKVLRKLNSFYEIEKNS